MRRRVLKHKEGLERGEAGCPPQLLATRHQEGLFHHLPLGSLVQREDNRPLGPKNLPHKNVLQE